jgi:hypothetical protein
MRKMFIVGNWKMNQNLDSIESFFTNLSLELGNPFLLAVKILVNKIMEPSQGKTPRNLFKISEQPSHSSVILREEVYIKKIMTYLTKKLNRPSLKT